MRDPLEVAACIGIGEDDRAEAGAVEAAVGPDHVPSEACRHLVESRLAGTHHLAGKLVGVDDDRAMRREHPVDRALAGCDTPGHADQSHGRGPYSCSAAAGRRRSARRRRPGTRRPSPRTHRHGGTGACRGRRRPASTPASALSSSVSAPLRVQHRGGVARRQQLQRGRRRGRHPRRCAGSRRRPRCRARSIPRTRTRMPCGQSR